MEAVQSAFPTEKSYVVSTDFDSAPYGYFVNAGTRFMAPRRFMEKARDKSEREFAKILANAKSRGEIFDDDFGDIIMEEWAKFTTKSARDFAPVDTGELAYGVEGKGIHWFRKE